MNDGDFDMPKSSITSKIGKVMDFRPSSGLASGLKRIGGRSGITRLGRSPIKVAQHGKIRISHKY